MQRTSAANTTGFLLSALLALAPCPSLAEEGAPAAAPATPTPEPVLTPVNPEPVLTPVIQEPLQPPPERPTWVDEGHAAVAEGLLWSVERLDHFFADEREVDLPRGRSFVRWRNELKARDDGAFAFGTGARADLELPSLDRRLHSLRLTISGGSTDPRGDLQAAGAPAPDASTRPSAGLRLALLDALLTQTDLSAGLLFSLPVGWFTRLRLRHVHPVEGLLVARLALAVFWQTPTGWGTRQDAELERQLLHWLVLRLDGTGTVTERSRGWEWGSELSLLAALGSRTAAFLGAGPNGATAVGPVVETWKAHARLRRDVARRWLFLELEPGVQWLRPPGGGRQRERFVILRLEVQFDAAGLAAPATPSGGG